MFIRFQSSLDRNRAVDALDPRYDDRIHNLAIGMCNSFHL